jgi:hypothetical protein
LDLSRKESERARAMNLANIKALENARQADLQRRYEEEQRQKQMNANRESRCELARAQGLAAPTMTGGWGESLQKGNEAYNACMAGLPAPQGTNIICQRQGANDLYCFRQ